MSRCRTLNDFAFFSGARVFEAVKIRYNLNVNICEHRCYACNPQRDTVFFYVNIFLFELGYVSQNSFVFSCCLWVAIVVNIFF